MITRTQVTFLISSTGNSDNGFPLSRREENSSPLRSEEIPFNLINSDQYGSDPTQVKHELDNLRVSSKFTTPEEDDKSESLKPIKGHEGTIRHPTERELVSSSIDSIDENLLSNGVPGKEGSNQLSK